MLDGPRPGAVLLDRRLEQAVFVRRELFLRQPRVQAVHVTLPALRIGSRWHPCFDLAPVGGFEDFDCVYELRIFFFGPPAFESDDVISRAHVSRSKAQQATLVGCVASKPALSLSVGCASFVLVIYAGANDSLDWPFFFIAAPTDGPLPATPPCNALPHRCRHCCVVLPSNSDATLFQFPSPHFKTPALSALSSVADHWCA